MAKSADAFRTISEVADWLDTPAHVLRFWESKFAQVKPVKRAGGRRYYRPSDMLLLGGIKKLLHSDGMTIKGVQKLLREHGVKHVAAHSQPLDDITAAEDKAATVEVDAPPLEEPKTEPVLDATPQEVAPPEADAPKSDEGPEAAADEDAADTAAEPEIAEAAADDAEEDAPPVMPSFSHRPVQEDEPAPPADEETEEVANAPPAPKPTVVSTPEDPADDVAADPGVLARLSALNAPVSNEMADRLADVLDRLRQSGGGNGTGQNG